MSVLSSSLVAALVAIPAVTIAQPTTGIITEPTGQVTSVVTDDCGQYQTAALPQGPYRLEAALDGFQASARRIATAAGQTATVDLTLAPAAVNEALVVTARRTEEVAQEVPIPVS